MNSGDIYENAANVPNNIQMSISDYSGTKNYNLTEEQSNLRNNLKMEYKTLFVNNFIYTWLAIILGVICVFLLFFQFIRKYAFVALCVIIVSWIMMTLHFNYRGNQISKEIDALLGPLEV